MRKSDMIIEGLRESHNTINEQTITREDVLKSINSPRVKQLAEKRMKDIQSAVARMKNSSDGKVDTYKNYDSYKDAEKQLMNNMEARMSGEKLDSESELATGPYGSQHKYPLLKQWEEQTWKAGADEILTGIKKYFDGK